jgi:hypothetical protein
MWTQTGWPQITDFNNPLSLLQPTSGEHHKITSATVWTENGVFVGSKNYDLTKFANFVGSALRTRVPCSRPYGVSDFQLMQLISNDKVVEEVEKRCLFRCKHVLKKPRHRLPTLIECFKDENQRQELEELVRDPSVLYKQASDLKDSSCPKPIHVNGISPSSTKSWKLTEESRNWQQSKECLSEHFAPPSLMSH